MGTWVLRLLLALWELWAAALKAAVQRSGLSICGYARTSSPLDWGVCVCVPGDLSSVQPYWSVLRCQQEKRVRRGTF